MGSVRKAPRTAGRRKDEVRWEARYRDPSGRQRTRTFSSQSHANAFLNAIETHITRGDYIDPAAGRVTFGEMGGGVPGWLSGQAGHSKGPRP
jgi:hypothetical protein